MQELGQGVGAKNYTVCMFETLKESVKNILHKNIQREMKMMRKFVINSNVKME